MEMCAQGNLTGAMAVQKGTPTTYNKDNQEIWELLFSTVDSMQDTVGISTGVLSTLTINKEKMLTGLSADMLATDLAEYLVRKVRILLGLLYTYKQRLLSFLVKHGLY
jgi:argininosuccinate lyase